jgi:hypothetical protein
MEGRAVTDIPELSREDALEAMQDLATDLYRAEDRIGFVREMLDAHTGPLDPDTVRAWLDRPVCPRAESEQQQIRRLEATLAAVREYVETSDDDGITAREIVLGLLGGKTIGEVEAGRATRVAAPGPGSNERASSVGACPVCRRVPDLGVCPVQHSRQLPAGGHCACACEETPA